MRVYLVVVICFISAKTASAKGGGGGSYGTTVCPCFCSVRTGDDTSPYWDYNFGEEADFKCSTPCYKTSDAEFNQLGHCGDVVSQYELGGFCGRAFQVANTTFPKLFDPTGTTVVDSTPSSYLASLDGACAQRLGRTLVVAVAVAVVVAVAAIVVVVTAVVAVVWGRGWGWLKCRQPNSQAAGVSRAPDTWGSNPSSSWILGPH